MWSGPAAELVFNDRTARRRWDYLIVGGRGRSVEGIRAMELGSVGCRAARDWWVPGSCKPASGAFVRARMARES